MYHSLYSPRLLRFLIECGAGSGETSGSSGLSRILEYVHLWMGEYEIFDYLIDIYECSIQPPKSLEDKEGLRWFVCRYHDGMHPSHSAFYSFGMTRGLFLSLLLLRQMPLSQTLSRSFYKNPRMISKQLSKPSLLS